MASKSVTLARKSKKGFRTLVFHIAPMKSLIISTFALAGLICSAGAEPVTKPAVTQAKLKKAAYQIDKHVADIFKTKRLSVPKVVDDGTFLRRTFLVGAGRIPTLKEAQSFLEIEDADKRALLVNYLLGTDGYRSHMQNYIMDLLRIKDRGGSQGNASSEPYDRFVYESVRDNMPWNTFTKKLVGAKGIAWEPGNGSVGYYVRDMGMPLDNLSITMQVFAGERFECAQCHDSPSNVSDWERMDFYELAAFTHGQEQINPKVWMGAVRHLDDPDWRRGKYSEIMYWLRDTIHYNTLGNGGHGTISLPADYQYRDGDPGEMVRGKTKFGKKLSSGKRDHGKSRGKFADWLTTENDNFDYIIVNRMWERVMGSPITAPVDVYRKSSETISPALMNYLKHLMRELNYDLKAFQNVLLLTKTFQFAANSEAFGAGVPQAFNGRQLRRMSAEQVWDSLVTLIARDPDKLAKRSFSDAIFFDGKPRLVGKKTMAELSKEVMSINDPAKYIAYVDGLMEEFKSDGYSSKKSSKSMGMMMQGRSRPGPASGVARASELSAPAPMGHLLREFGQSDRELINSSTVEPNIAQVLQIMNGHVENLVVSNDGAAVYKALEAGANDGDKVRYIYYAILSRPPTEPEMNMLLRDVIDGSRTSYQNLVSALISTHEFLFVQ